MNHIDKEIYHQQSVSRRLRPLSLWYWAFALVGVICTFLFITLTTTEDIGSLLLGGIVIGDFCLLVVVCYFLFGDKWGAYHQEDRQFLNREFFYYPRSCRSQLLDAAARQDYGAIAKIKKGSSPELMLVRYSNDDESRSYFQVFEVQGGSEQPLTEVTVLNSGAAQSDSGTKPQNQ